MAYVNELLGQYTDGLQVRDRSLYVRALTHRSAHGAPPPPLAAARASHSNNERLEFLGDAVLYLALTAYLHQRYPMADEGMLTKIRTKLVAGRMLADLCKRHTQLGNLLITSGRTAMASAAAHEDAFEAWLGAIHEDQGYEAARRWLIGFLEDHVDFAQLVAHRDNPKDVLNRRLRVEHGVAPTYEQLPAVLAHDGTTVHHVRIRSRDGSVLATGSGPDPQRAETSAARRALQTLGCCPTRRYSAQPCAKSKGPGIGLT